MLVLIKSWEHRNSCSEFTHSEPSVQQRNEAILFKENKVVQEVHCAAYKVFKGKKKIIWTALDLQLYLVRFMLLPSHRFLPTNAPSRPACHLLLERLLTKPIQGLSLYCLIWCHWVNWIISLLMILFCLSCFADLQFTVTLLPLRHARDVLFS